MEHTPSARLVSLPKLSRHLAVPATWLRREALAGRIPHLRAGSRLLFDVDLVEQVLLARLREQATAVAHSGGLQ